MLDIKFIRSNPDIVKKAIEDKHTGLDLDHLLKVDQEFGSLKKELEELQRQRNVNAKEIKSVPKEEKEKFITLGREIGARIKEVQPRIQELEDELKQLMYQTPNIPAADAPRGVDDKDNVVVKTYGDKAQFDFTPIDHVDLLNAQNWADFDRVPKIAGSRNYCLKNEALLLEQAIIRYALDLLMEKGFDVASFPSMARESALLGTGHFPGGKDQVYYMPEDDLYLTGTAEVPINSLYSGDILNVEDLPIKIGGFSPCFRREAGSAGRDVRGLIRVHQFYKVEQFVICENSIEETEKWHKAMLEISEEILQTLDIPYQIVECCTGDMGLGKYKMFDIESWVPSEEKYRETHSCSAILDWQSRRTNTRYRDTDGEIKFCHTLNNTAIATPRFLVPFLENHQTADKRIKIPEALRSYMGGKEFIGKSK